MKRLIVIAFTFFAFSVSFAQDTTAVKVQPAPAPVATDDYKYDKFNFGLCITPSINWMNPSGTGVENDGVKVGFSYGIIGDISFAQRYSFSTGIDIAYMGGNLKYDASYDTVNHVSGDQLKLNYVNIPISLKMRTNKVNPKMAFFGQFGFVPGISIGAKSTQSYSDGKPDENVGRASDATDVVFGLRIGAGIEYFLSGNTRASLGITWNQGFSPVVKGDNESKANYIAFQIGIFF